MNPLQLIGLVDKAVDSVKELSSAIRELTNELKVKRESAGNP